MNQSPEVVGVLILARASQVTISKGSLDAVEEILGD